MAAPSAALGLGARGREALHLGVEGRGAESDAECSHDREQALEAWKDGRASLWLFHVTHNAGTALKMLLQRNSDVTNRPDPGGHPIRSRSCSLEASIMTTCLERG